MIGSPLKKARPSIDQTAATEGRTETQSLSAALNSAVSNNDATPTATAAQTSSMKVEDEEEL